MPSFHETQEVLLLSHGYGIIDDEELLLLYEEYMPNNPDFSYEEYERYSGQEDMNNAECLAEFRFKKRDLSLLAEVFQIPESFTCYQRSVSSGMKPFVSC
jgi:hypothetical protein